MSSSSRSQARGEPGVRRPGLPQWEELASLVIVIAREFRVRGYRHPEAIPLTQSEASVMHHLFASPGALPSQVAAGTGLQRSNLSAVLRELEQKGLVERVDDPDDARSVHLHATPLAIRNHELVRREWGTTMCDAADGAVEVDVDAMLPLLRRIADGMIRDRQRDDGR